MLVIRNKQLEVFESLAMSQLEEDLVEHLHRAFPVDFELAGVRGVRASVNQAVRQAGEYGLETRGQFCRYVNLAITFGTHFDSDPLLAWAGQTLSDPELADPEERVDEIEDLALEQLALIAGESGELYRGTLRRLGGLGLEQLSCASGALEPATWALLQELQPELAESAPADGRREFARITAELVREKGLSSERGALIVPALLFLLGSHAATDPLHSWIASILDDQTLTGEGAREQALVAGARGYVERALALMRAAGTE
jgi:hypothetical protein